MHAALGQMRLELREAGEASSQARRMRARDRSPADARSGPREATSLERRFLGVLLGFLGVLFGFFRGFVGFYIGAFQVV